MGWKNVWGAIIILLNFLLLLVLMVLGIVGLCTNNEKLSDAGDIGVILFLAEISLTLGWNLLYSNDD